MKQIFIIIGIALLFFSCEKVIDLELKEGKKELVVDAAIDWIQGTSGTVQKIEISKTSAYFKEENPRALGASVMVRNTKNKMFTFKEESEGVYVCRDFEPEYDEVYSLKVEYENVTYESSDTLRKPMQIYDVVQTEAGGVENKDKEVRVYFTTKDTSSSQYFLVGARDKDNVLPFYFVLDGNDFKDRKYVVVGSSDEWQTGDKLDFEIYHISETYFNYMSLLLAVADKYTGRPLTTPPVRVQGNIVNIANSKENPLGAFRATSCLKTTIVVE